MQSSNLAKLGSSYTVKVKASYASLTTISNTMTFTVQIEADCQYNTLTPSYINNFSYSVVRGTATFTFAAFGQDFPL